MPDRKHSTKPNDTNHSHAHSADPIADQGPNHSLESRINSVTGNHRSRREPLLVISKTFKKNNPKCLSRPISNDTTRDLNIPVCMTTVISKNYLRLRHTNQGPSVTLPSHSSHTGPLHTVGHFT